MLEDLKTLEATLRLELERLVEKSKYDKDHHVFHARGLDRFWYRVVWGLGTVQTLILELCVHDPMWRSSDGKVAPLSSLSDEHLRNIRRILRRRDTDARSLHQIETEIRRRGVT